MKDVSSKKRHALLVIFGATIVLIAGAILLPGQGNHAKAETSTPVAPSVTASVTASTSTMPLTPTPAPSPETGASPTTTSTPPTTVQRHPKFKPADSAFGRATFQPGQVITTSGMFFVDIDTGVVENW